MNPDFVRVDLERAERCGRAEAIFCEGKLPSEVAAVAKILRGAGQAVLATRADQAHFDAVSEIFPEAVWHARARCITVGSYPPAGSKHTAAVVCAGTADLPVADEAAVALESFGHRVERITDVGVAGLHRLLSETGRLRSFSVLIVVAGMEGALPSVVAGLGANLGGIAALLGMLTSCSSKVTVVNIDNGFGAACAADAILRLADGGR
jgi:NCAIR mutase (PurE)-related protein